MNMKQVYCEDIKNLNIREMEMPKAGSGQVRIKVAYCGICGSDIHIFKGEHPLMEGKYPVELGHEFSGIVDDIGSGVKGLEIGKKVTVQPVRSCGQCWTCKKGLVAICPEQTFYMGGMADYFIVDADNAIVLDDNTDLRHAAMIEPLAVGVHGANMIKELRSENVLVSGAGTIGLLTAVSAKNKGAKKVFISDLIDSRLKIAEELGLIPINILKESVEETLVKETGKNYTRYTFECVGNEKSLSTCVKHTDRGGEVIAMGVYGMTPKVDMFRVEDREIAIRGALEYTWEDFREAAKMVEKKKINLDLLLTQEFPLDKVKEAFEFVMNNSSNCIKVLIKN